MNWTIIILEAVILTIAFTAMILIPLVKNPVWWIHDYPSILPFFKENKIGCFSYGLVNGKQQCQYPWNPVENGKPVPFTEEPEVWFHDLFRPDGTPYSAEEVRFIKEMTH